MIIPNIRYYARMEYDTYSKKTPKYVIIAEAGYYEPMEHIKGRNGLVSMYLMEKLKEQNEELKNINYSLALLAEKSQAKTSDEKEET